MQCKNMHNLFFQKIKKTCITYWDLFYFSAIEGGRHARGQCLKSIYQATHLVTNGTSGTKEMMCGISICHHSRYFVAVISVNKININ